MFHKRISELKVYVQKAKIRKICDQKADTRKFYGPQADIRIKSLCSKSGFQLEKENADEKN